MSELDIEIEVGSATPLPVLPTSTDVELLRGSGTLCGWSLGDATTELSQSIEGSVVAPAALTTIAASLGIPVGEYTVSWSVELIGAAAAADANNFELIVGGNPGIPSLNQGAAGVYPQQAEQVFLLNNQSVLIKNIGAGTAGVTYAVQFSITPSSQVDVVAELRNAGQPLGRISMSPGQSDTRWFGLHGVDIVNDLTLHVIQGIITGAVFASFGKV